MNLSFGSIGFDLSYCDFHSRTLWHTTLHTWSTFLIVKKPDDITVLKEEKILCIVFFMTFLKYSFPGPFIKATQNFQGIFNFFCRSKANIFQERNNFITLTGSWTGVGLELAWSWLRVGLELAASWLGVDWEFAQSLLGVVRDFF